MSTFGQTTAPGADTTAGDAGDASSLGLVLVYSASQPERVGQVAFFPLGVRLFAGRGEPAQIDEFAHFVPQCPGEVPAVDLGQDFLGGATLSRRQAAILDTGDALEVEQVGGCRTYFNGLEKTKGILRPGDTVMFRNEVVLLCVSRPRALPALSPARALHAFGEPDAGGIVGESPAAWRMREELGRAARGSSHVLIQGESGTGKELAAAAIHAMSRRGGVRGVAHTPPAVN
jgi:two-component system nitrogen regulation response regulator GlnG/two-component system response regulator HydG